MPTLVTYKGHRFSAEFAHALVELDRLTPTTSVVIVQGGWNGTTVAASAGTHAGDAVDISVLGITAAQADEIVLTARQLGIAMWHRYRWQGFDGDHLHGVPNGWGYPSAGARAQAVAYRLGRNGLARNGADNGPGGYRTRTWGGYLKANGLTLGADGRVVTAAAKAGPLVTAATASLPRRATTTPTAAPVATTPTIPEDDMDYKTFSDYMDRYGADLAGGRRGMGPLHSWSAVPWHAGFGRKTGTKGTSPADWYSPMERIAAMIKAAKR